MTECVVTEKACTRCGITKPLAEFHRRATSCDGLNYAYKACVLQKRRAYVAANLEVVRATNRAYHHRNREQRAENSREFHRRRPEWTTEWQRAHPENMRVARSNVRARRAGRPGKVTLAQWRQVLLFYGNACAKCHVSGSAEPLTIDHFIPTAKGGENIWQNIWPLCLTCNHKKYDTLPTEPAPPHVAVLFKTGT